ncbi:MAG: chorismate synthase [Deltaproteobacteria bacterium]|nr:chorismate synthase [Deltaproteobacteria bacterium]
MLRYLTSGESHGKALMAILEGMPSGLAISSSFINGELKRRQSGYGRGGRMRIESDRAEIISGIRGGLTLGSPIGLLINNRDWENWKDAMSPGAVTGDSRAVTRPRPGHADLTGGLKYDHTDLRNILERSSARETAARVAVGAVAKRLLEEFGIEVYSWVTNIGGVEWKASHDKPGRIFEMAEASDLRCPDAKATDEMKKRIDRARKDGDSLGGIFEVVAVGVPPGLGSHVQWDRKLDGRLAQALMSIQAIKGVEAGVGFRAGALPGSRVHDEIFYKRGGTKVRGFWPQTPRFFRKTNNAGGIEGGMSNGEPVVLRAVMKPIPTLYKPLRSIDIQTKRPFKASVERSDICAVPAAAVIAEGAVAFELANAFIDKFGGDSVAETGRNYRGYLKQISVY